MVSRSAQTALLLLVIGALASAPGCLFGATNALDAGAEPGTVEPEPEPAPGVPPEPGVEPDDDGGQPATPEPSATPEPDDDGGQPATPEPDDDGGQPATPEPSATPEPDPDTVLVNARDLSTRTLLIRGDTATFEVLLAANENVAPNTITVSDGWTFESLENVGTVEAPVIHFDIQLTDDRLALPDEFSDVVPLVVRFDSLATRYRTELDLMVQRAEGPHVDVNATSTDDQSCGHPALPCPTIAAAIAGMTSAIMPTDAYPREIRLWDDPSNRSFVVAQDLDFEDLGLSSGWSEAPGGDDRVNWVQAVDPTIHTRVALGQSVARFGPTDSVERRVEWVSFDADRSITNSQPAISVEGPLVMQSVRAETTYDGPDFATTMFTVDVLGSGTLTVDEASVVIGPICDACAGPSGGIVGLGGIRSAGNTTIDGMVTGGSGVQSPDTTFSVGFFVDGGTALVRSEAMVQGGAAPNCFGAFAQSGIFTTQPGLGDGPVFMGAATTGGATPVRATGFLARDDAVFGLLTGTYIGGTATNRVVGISLLNLDGMITIEEADIHGSPPDDLTNVAVGVFIDAPALGRSMTVRLQESQVIAEATDRSMGIHTVDLRGGGNTAVQYGGTVTVNSRVFPLNFVGPQSRSVGILSEGIAVAHISQNSAVLNVKAEGPSGVSTRGIETQSSMNLVARVAAEETGSGNVPDDPVIGVLCENVDDDVTVTLVAPPLEQASVALDVSSRFSPAVAISNGPTCAVSLVGSSDVAPFNVTVDSASGTATVIDQEGPLTTSFTQLFVDRSTVGVGIEAACGGDLVTLSDTTITLTHPSESVERYGIRTSAGVDCAPTTLTYRRGAIAIGDALGDAYGIFFRDRSGSTVHLDQLDVTVADGDTAIGIDVEYDSSDILIERNIVEVRLIGEDAVASNVGVRLSGSAAPKSVQVRNNYVRMENPDTPVSTGLSVGILVDTSSDDASVPQADNIILAHNTILTGDIASSVGLGATAIRASGDVDHLLARAFGNYVVARGSGVGIVEACVPIGGGPDAKAARFSGDTLAPNVVGVGLGMALVSYATIGPGCVETNDFAFTALTGTTSETTSYALDPQGCSNGNATSLNNAVTSEVVMTASTSVTFGDWGDNFNGINATARGPEFTDVGVCEMPGT